MIENIIGNHRYTVSDEYVAEAFNLNDSEGSAPWHRQPDYPDGTPFTSVEEAEKWIVNLLIELKQNEESALLQQSEESIEEDSEVTE